LREIGPVADAVARAGTLGLEAIEYLQAGRPAPEDWIAKRKSELDRCAQPRAEVVIAAARPVRLLLDAIELRARGANKPAAGANAAATDETNIRSHRTAGRASRQERAARSD